MQLRKYISGKKSAGEIKKLYISAFPPDERAPFDIIIKKAVQNKAEMFSAYDNGEFVGFAYTVQYKNAVYLFFLAVVEEKRGRGYGSRIINAVRKLYNGKKIFLGREQLDRTAENYEQRVNRRNFYIKCGFVDIPCIIEEAGVKYDVMSVDGKIISAEEYDKIITLWGGWLRKIFFRMRLLKK